MDLRKFQYFALRNAKVECVILCLDETRELLELAMPEKQACMAMSSFLCGVGDGNSGAHNCLASQLAQ